MRAKIRADVIVVGAGHNGLLAALLLALRGQCGADLRGPRNRGSTYLLRLMPPELLQATGAELP